MQVLSICSFIFFFFFCRFGVIKADKRSGEENDWWGSHVARGPGHVEEKVGGEREMGMELFFFPFHVARR